MNIDELIKKYGKNVSKLEKDSDDESEEEEEENINIEIDEETVDSIKTVSIVEGDETNARSDVTLKNLFEEKQIMDSESCDSGDALLNDVAAIAQSIQPKGNTLSSTNVVTPIPELLRYTLREYQHIGLDWLVTMHDRNLNGILADEMGIKLF